MLFFEPVLIIIVIVFLFLYSALKVVREYERLVVFRLGRLLGTRGPGLVLLIPFVDRAERVSLRVVTLDVPTQEVITRDNVTTSVNAVVYFRVVEPASAIVNVERFYEATAQLAQTTLRSVAGQAELDELLAERDKLNHLIQKILDEATDAWGIKVTAVEIKDVVVPELLQRSISRQAAAERERRAIIIQAEERRRLPKNLPKQSILNRALGIFYQAPALHTGDNQPARQYPGLPLPVELKNLLGGLEAGTLKAFSQAIEEAKEAKEEGGAGEG